MNLMMNDELQHALDISLKLNKLLEGYCEKTVRIKELLEYDNEETFEQINELLDQREVLIACYDQLKQDKPGIDDQIHPALAEASRARQKLLEQAKSQEASNLDILNRLHGFYREKLREIHDGKKFTNAYHYAAPLTDGIFFDKRK